MASGLGFALGTLQTALHDNREHICTPEDCPPMGGYYVSCVDDNGNVFLMAGPYRTHGQALADESKACKIASDIDGRAWFYSWGTSRVRAGDNELKPGVLNKHKLI
jgi:hypothetical protein